MALALRKKIKQGIYRLWNRAQLTRIRRIKQCHNVYVIDIDNTLTINGLGDQVDHINPKPRKALIDYIIANWYKSEKVIFLSARNIRLYSSTKHWLREQGFQNVSLQNLFLVDTAKSKIEYLQLLVGNNIKVTFLDDLSYNHENGEVRYYDEVVSSVQKIDLTYLGIHFISRFK